MTISLTKWLMENKLKSILGVYKSNIINQKKQHLTEPCQYNTCKQ